MLFLLCAEVEVIEIFNRLWFIQPFYILLTWCCASRFSFCFVNINSFCGCHYICCPERKVIGICLWLCYKLQRASRELCNYTFRCPQFIGRNYYRIISLNKASSGYSTPFNLHIFVGCVMAKWKSVKQHIRKIKGNSLFLLEKFATLFSQIEVCLNWWHLYSL